MNNFSTLFEPNYTILTFLMIKTFFYVEAIGVLGLIRAMVATGPSRWAALGAFVLALTGVAAKYVPPVVGLTGSDIGRSAAQVVNAGGGMALPLGVSLVLALSALLKGRRWWLLDAAHLLGATLFFGLWGYTLL